jgi:hypothetical protein
MSDGILYALENGENPLKNLGYGRDRPGGGSSKQPYIKKPFNLGLQSPAYSNEFIVRGGLKAPVSAIEDVVRLTKYFFDLRNPSGLLFVAKQNILSRTAVKTEASYGFAYGGFTQDINTKTNETSINENNGIFNDGIYTPLSTLVQAGIGWAGGHINKQGLDPSGLFPSFAINKYVDVAFDRNRLERNAEDPKVPLALYRKAQKATAKVAREREKLIKQGTDTINELATPPSTFAFPSSPDAPPVSSLKKAENAINKFLQKWDAFRDQLELKKLNSQAKDTQRAIDKADDLNAQVAAAESAPPVYNNRLLKLWNSSGLNLSNPIDNNNSVLFTYSGGPDSILGIGKTTIHFATKNDGITPDRTNEAPVTKMPPTAYSTVNIFGDENSTVSLRYASLIDPTISQYDLFGTENFLEDYNLTPNIQAFNPDNPSNARVDFATTFDFTDKSPSIDNDFPLEDFRKSLDPNLHPTILSTSPSYIDKNIEQNFNLGNPGQRGNIVSYTNGKRDLFSGKRLGPVDSINAYPIYKTNSLTEGSRYPGVSGGVNRDKALKDMIPFYIAILNNDTQKGGTYKKYIHFRSFIEDVSDSYDADWDAIEYMGRAEKFYKYGGFSRKMSMAFKVVAQSREELNLMYDKLNFLASSLAPEYLDSEVSGYMAGNIAYITLGGYLSNQPGIITNLDYSIPEDSPWEIGIDDSGVGLDAKDIRQLPHMIDVKLNFIPIHKFRPEKQTFVNDTLGTNSTRLLATGKQRYIDQLRPEVLNYDQEAYDTFKKEQITAETQILKALGIIPSPNSSTPIQTDEQLNFLPDPPAGPIDPNITLGDQSGLVTGVDNSNSIFNNTLFQ